MELQQLLEMEEMEQHLLSVDRPLLMLVVGVDQPITEEHLE
jgi:hypothetical protein